MDRALGRCCSNFDGGRNQRKSGILRWSTTACQAHPWVRPSLRCAQGGAIRYVLLQLRGRIVGHTEATDNALSGPAVSARPEPGSWTAIGTGIPDVPTDLFPHTAAAVCHCHRSIARLRLSASERDSGVRPRWPGQPPVVYGLQESKDDHGRTHDGLQRSGVRAFLSLPMALGAHQSSRGRGARLRPEKGGREQQEHEQTHKVQSAVEIPEAVELLDARRFALPPAGECAGK